MGEPTYWLDLFTGTTWDEFLADGAKETGFRERRWNTVQRVKPGDYFLCYMTGVMRFVGVLEVISEPFRDDRPIWTQAVFPCRLRVRALVTVPPEAGVPVLDLRDRLSIFKNQRYPNSWTGHFRGSPNRFTPEDGKAIADALFEAKRKPVIRPVDNRKLDRVPPTLRASRGRTVTVPAPAVDEPLGPQEPQAAKPREHTEIQWLLLKLGNDMGLDIWVARNDRSQAWDGNRFADLPRMKRELPRQFDEAIAR
jgi:predicted RNA-binding protein